MNTTIRSRAIATIIGLAACLMLGACSSGDGDGTAVAATAAGPTTSPPTGGTTGGGGTDASPGTETGCPDLSRPVTGTAVRCVAP